MSVDQLALARQDRILEVGWVFSFFMCSGTHIDSLGSAEELWDRSGEWVDCRLWRQVVGLIVSIPNSLGPVA